MTGRPRAPTLLGVKAVITESFERIHRSNLVGMGVLPLTFKEGMDRKTLGLKGDEMIDILGLENLAPRMDIKLVIKRANGTTDTVDAALPRRYRRRGELLPPRRHPAVRAARHGEGGLRAGLCPAPAGAERPQTPEICWVMGVVGANAHDPA